MPRRVFRCKYCGQDGLQWEKLMGKYRPINQNGSLHQCLKDSGKTPEGGIGEIDNDAETPEGGGIGEGESENESSEGDNEGMELTLEDIDEIIGRLKSAGVFDEGSGENEGDERGKDSKGNGEGGDSKNGKNGEDENDNTANIDVDDLLEKLKEYVDYRLSDYDIENVKQVLTEEINRLTDEKSKKVKKELKKELKDLAPVEHFITYDTPDGGGKIEGKPHYNLNKLVSVLAQRLHVFMVGPAGSGKTTSASQAAEILNLPYYEASLGPATSQWDLVGFKSPDGRYIPGILREPYEKGGLLMLDEMDNSNPSVLTALNSAMANGKYTFPDGQVEQHPDFVLVAAGNTYGRGADRMYVGRNQLDAATLDRFVVINWDYDEGAEIQWAGTDQIDWTKYVQAVRHEVQNLSMRIVISPRASIFGARLLRAGVGRQEVADMVLWKGSNTEDRNRVEKKVKKEYVL